MRCATIGVVHLVLDSSSLISLAWSGQLELLKRTPMPLVIPVAVHQETVTEGLARGYADAAGIEQAIKAIPEADTDSAAEAGVEVVDHVVLVAGQEHGALLTNDIALGRRAANHGVRWLRTADFVVLCVRTDRLSTEEGITAIRALRSAGRITDALLDDYLEELS
jgi:hypothetical protein